MEDFSEGTHVEFAELQAPPAAPDADAGPTGRERLYVVAFPNRAGARGAEPGVTGGAAAGPSTGPGGGSRFVLRPPGSSPAGDAAGPGPGSEALGSARAAAPGERRRKLQQAEQEALQNTKLHALLHMPAGQSLRAAEQAACQAVRHAVLECETATCLHCGAGGVRRQQTAAVIIVGLLHRHELLVPVLACDACGAHYSVHPMQLDCMSATPGGWDLTSSRRPRHLWLDMQLLDWVESMVRGQAAGREGGGDQALPQPRTHPPTTTLPQARIKPTCMCCAGRECAGLQHARSGYRLARAPPIVWCARQQGPA